MVRTARKHGEVPAKTNEEYFDKNYMNLLILTMTSSILYTLHCCIVGTLLVSLSLSLASHHSRVWHIVRWEDVTVCRWRSFVHVSVEERRLLRHPDAGGVACDGAGAGGGCGEVCGSPGTRWRDHVGVLHGPVWPPGQLQHAEAGLGTVLVLSRSAPRTQLTLLQGADYTAGNDQEPDDRDQNYQHKTEIPL